MNRFLVSVCFFVCFCCAAVEAKQPPNIVMIFCDDLTNQALSCYGHPLKLLDTPHIDRLAQEGMLFRRCMVPNSICGPSRAAILTGKYAHVNGFCCNGDEFVGSQPTFSKMLQSAGYQTAGRLPRGWFGSRAAQ